MEEYLDNIWSRFKTTSTTFPTSLEKFDWSLDFDPKTLSVEDLNHKYPLMTSDLVKWLEANQKTFRHWLVNDLFELSDRALYKSQEYVLIINFHQCLTGQPIQITRGIYAIALLAPMCDGYMDDPEISKEAKITFSKNLYQRLQNPNVTTNNPLERQIFRVMSLLEENYPRSSHPLLYQALIKLHQLQIQSTKWQKNPELDRLSEMGEVEQDKILSCSGKLMVCKGAVTSLIFHLVGQSGDDNDTDDKSAEIDWSDPNVNLSMNWGAFTQILDDLMDIENDKADGIWTYPRLLLQHKQTLDEYTNQALNYLSELYESSDQELVSELISPWFQIIFQHIAYSHDNKYYSPEYINRFSEFRCFQWLRVLPLKPTFKEAYRSCCNFEQFKGWMVEFCQKRWPLLRENAQE